MTLLTSLRESGFAFQHAPDTRAWLQAHGSLTDWPAFAASWNGMELDKYMADGGRYRRRRYAVFAAAPGQPIAREPHQPHFQATSYNNLNGGIDRWFEPIPETITAGASLQTILSGTRALFDALSPATSWHIELHQFRIEAGPDLTGQPTPEGHHRDGVDWVLVLMVHRENIASGTTSIHTLDGTELGHFTLTHPLDAALVDDGRVTHGVTAVRPLDAGKPAHRDVLVVTYRRQG